MPKTKLSTEDEAFLGLLYDAMHGVTDAMVDDVLSLIAFLNEHLPKDGEQAMDKREETRMVIAYVSACCMEARGTAASAILAGILASALAESGATPPKGGQH